MKDLEYELQYSKIVEHIQYMQYHVLIYKFIGIFIFEKELIEGGGC